MTFFPKKYIIYVTENIYWINGLEYEKALLAGSERRKKFALQHLKRMGAATIFGLVLSGVSFIFGWNLWITYIVVVIIFVGVTISTINIEL